MERAVLVLAPFIVIDCPVGGGSKPGKRLGDMAVSESF